MSTRVAVSAETFAASPHTELIPPGSVRRFRRAANVGATVIHRLFHPLIKMWQESAMTDRSDESKLDEAEMTALTTILNALSRLDDAARGRVLRWACDRFEVVA